ncbi:serine/threonine-protein kinase [Nonomuraea sp. NPDC000554]|uniref:serine/threonine-protein kinase n=1 Tax=Nonomuraea sp. NPDC000554 TaxID=3154259 RepID=UPI00333173A1
MPNVEPLRDGDPAAVGAYRIVGRLGAGGQGVVYLGQAPDGGPVAVKVLREVVAGDDRFAKEIAAARRVEPFCIAQVLDASLGGRPYIVSEYVEGPSLQQAGRHTGADLQRLAVSTATALAAIHQAGIVHRDFKPANVLLGRDGPRVIDFGIARAADASATVTSSIVGTPAYMAPEQLAGAVVGQPADVFAWASVIVFAATGSPPFGQDTVPAVINRVLHHEPQLGDLPQPLRSIVHACLDKEPHRRPAMRDVLLRLLGGQESPAPKPARKPAPTRFPLVAGVVGAVAVAGAVGVALTGVAVWKSASTGKAAPAVLAADSSGSKASSPTPTQPTPTKSGTSEPKKPGTPSARRTTARPRPTPTSTPTPSVRRTTARPRPTPTPTPTKKRPTPTPTPTKKRPTPTSSRTATGSASFTLDYVRVQGGSKINQEGVTCYVGTANFAVGLGSTKMGAPYSYQWIFDGKVIESGSSRLPSYARDDYLASKKVFTPSDGGHTVTFRLTSPVARAKSVSFTMCPTKP